MRSEDVALRAIGIVQKSNIGSAIRVVFNGSDCRGDAILIALPVDDAVLALVTTALMADSDAPLIVAPGFLRERREQGAFRFGTSNLVKTLYGHKAAPRRSRLKLLHSHVGCPSFSGKRHNLEQ